MDESKINQPMVLNLSNYAAPTVKEVTGRNWVKYGEDNEYFDYLLDRYRGSPTNHAIINGIVSSIYGNGLTVKGTSPQSITAFDTIFDEQDFKRWIFDLKCMGYYLYQIILNKELTKIVRIKHTPVQKWRSGKANEHGIVTNYYFSNDWDNYTNPKYRPKPYPVYTKGCKHPISIYPVKPYSAGAFYYPNVDYQGALQYAHIEEEISNFHINNLLNGMFPGLLINFNNGDPGPEARKDMETLVNTKWGGTSNTAKIIMAFNDDKDSAATIEPVMQPDLDKMFDLLSSESTDKIMVGHRVVSPMLFGVRDSSGLGNNADELRVASLLHEETVIRPYRTMIVEPAEQFMAYAGFNVELEFESLNPFPPITPDEPFQKMRNDNGMPQQPVNTDQNTELSLQRPKMSKQDADNWLAHLNGKGEVVNEDEWVELPAQTVIDENGELELLNGTD